MEHPLSDVIVLRPFVGICHMQVCVSKLIPDVAILAFANSVNPSGTVNG